MGSPIFKDLEKPLKVVKKPLKNFKGLSRDLKGLLKAFFVLTLPY